MRGGVRPALLWFPGSAPCHPSAPRSLGPGLFGESESLVCEGVVESGGPSRFGVSRPCGALRLRPGRGRAFARSVFRCRSPVWPLFRLLRPPSGLYCRCWAFLGWCSSRAPPPGLALARFSVWVFRFPVILHDFRRLSFLDMGEGIVLCRAGDSTSPRSAEPAPIPNGGRGGTYVTKKC